MTNLPKDLVLPSSDALLDALDRYDVPWLETSGKANGNGNV